MSGEILDNTGMVGEISEVDRSLGIYKIKYQTNEVTSYLVQNRSAKNAVVTFRFFDVFNIKFTAKDPVKILPATEEGFDRNVTVLVKANQTVHLVDLGAENVDDTWSYNYDYRIEKDAAPEWLQ
eukprot:PhF_6_TR4799/c0_g1_i1/m.6618